MPDLVPSTGPDAGYRLTNVDDDERLIQLWLRSKSANSKEAYFRDLSQFLEYSNQTLSDVKLDHIWDWVDHLNSLGLAVSTVSRKLAAIKSLFSFGNKVGYIPFNVGAAISLPKIPDELAQRILTESETKSILAMAKTFRDSVLLKLLYFTGARVSELTTLKWKHINEVTKLGDHSGCIVTLIGKGAKSRNVVVPQTAWSILLELQAQEKEAGYGSQNDPVFRSRKGGSLSRIQIWQIVKNATSASGIQRNVSPHWLRHAHASHSLDRGAPTHLVKETLGHKSLTTTSRYTHARPDDSSGNYLDV